MLWNAVLPGLVLLGLVIFVHELGHFLMAKWRRVRVLKFSLGFGPALVRFTRGETEYRISWIPLGGFVQMAGDSPESDGSMPGGPDEFLSHPWYGRALIAIAGPAANFITAAAVMVIVAFTGVSTPDYVSQLGPVSADGAAYRMGLREGDRIVAVNGTPVQTWGEIESIADRYRGGPLEFAVARGAETYRVHLTARERSGFFSSVRAMPIPPVVGTVVTGMPAYKAGLKVGDRIVAVGGHPISTWDEIPRALKGSVDRRVILKIARGKDVFDVAVTPMDPEGKGRDNARIGIEATYDRVYIQRYGFPEALDRGLGATVSMIGSVYRGMWLTISRPLYYREYVGGPLFIAQAASEQARRGLDAYLQFLAMINVAIAAFNLLPLPVLDGGHILLALLEAIRRQSISAQTYLRFQKVGLVVMGTLFVLILANDPLRLVQRQRALDRVQSPAATERPVAPP